MSKDVLMKVFAIFVVVVLLSALGWLWVGNVLTDGNGPGGKDPYGVPPVGSGTAFAKHPSRGTSPVRRR